MNNGSVLLVEDEQIIAMDLQESLEEMGYHVLGPACNADEALALARQHKPDMALLDIMIEGPVDGIDTAVELTQINIPCVFLTAYSDSHTLQRAAAISPYGILTKPVERPVLAVTLEQTLYKARLEAELRERHQRLASSEARLRAVFMDNPDAILVVDQQGAIVNINPRTADLFGYSEAELIGSPIEMLLPDQVRSQHVSHRQAFTAHPQLRPTRHCRPAGRRTRGNRSTAAHRRPRVQRRRHRRFPLPTQRGPRRRRTARRCAPFAPRAPRCASCRTARRSADGSSSAAARTRASRRRAAARRQVALGPQTARTRAVSSRGEKGLEM